MALVDYGSDSDSDSAFQSPPTPQPLPTNSLRSASLSALLPKPKPRSAVNGNATIVAGSSSAAGPRKIIVQLPKTEGRGDESTDEPPNKRARIAGMGVGGLGEGLASMLPAPKKRVIAASDVSLSASTRGVGLGVARKERLLGGGAARREDEGLVVMPGEGDGEGGLEGDMGEDIAGPTPPPPEVPPVENNEEKKQTGNGEAEVKKIAPVTQFMPQGVGRKTIQPASAFRKKKVTGPGRNGVGTVARGETTGAAVATGGGEPKSKVSLFGAAPSISALSKPPGSRQSAKDYKPLLITSLSEPPAPSTLNPLSAEETPTTYDHNGRSGYPYEQSFPELSETNSLATLATQIGLDNAAMRQLFGRDHSRGKIPTNIATFDVNTEYASNTLLAKNEAAVAAMSVNPVRSIAPGKHQLTQLLNAAQQQKGALEEHFADGKRNRREAGGKYGW